MKTITAVIALGPNSLSVPCLFYQSVGDAIKDFTENRGFVDSDFKQKDSGIYIGTRAGKDLCDLFDRELTDEEHAVDDEREEGSPDPVTFGIFTSYYGGCGGVGGFVIKELLLGQACVDWDLD